MSGICLISLVASLALGAGNVINHHVMVTANGMVEFSADEGGLWISRCEVNQNGGQQTWVASAPRVPLWTVTVQQGSGDRSAVTALDGPAQVCEASATHLEVAWTALLPGKVAVVMTVSVRGADLVWGLEASVEAQNCALWDITFPELGPVARPHKVHSITTAGWGLVHDDLMQQALIEGAYPSSKCTMPFAALSDGNTGLYIGSEDTEGYPLRLFVGRNKGRQAVTLGMRHDIPGMGTVKNYKIPYPVVTTGFSGDWYEAARIYRQAAQKTAWGHVPTLAERTGVPHWLVNTDLWYIGPCDDEKSAAAVFDFATYFEIPVSAHVYTWHEIPFDDHYPEYFPMKPGFQDAVTKVQAAGVAVMPYINGRLWDAATASWKERNARDAAALGLTGEPYSEVYASKVPLTPMCPATPLWQETVTGLVNRLVNEVGVRGVYIDQIAAAAPRRCFAKNHGHPPGGGSHWIQGYRELLRRCCAVLPPGAALSTEENADPWNDLLQAFLMVNTQPQGGTIVPIFPAVYGGRVVSFGFQYFSASDFEARYPLRLKFAQEFTFGSQLGWVGPGILEEGHAPEAEFLKRLGQARHVARDALQYGELLPPIAMHCSKAVSWTEKNEASIETKMAPAIVASAWLTPGAKRKLAVANVADEEVTVALTLDLRHTGDVQAHEIALRTSSGETAAVLRRKPAAMYHGKLTVPARDAFVLEILPAR
ncbi:MAG: hypothetical protein HYV26_17225 [Candidatus Hydrogenedentes bacterium]|nr:hypothetical protein [Candidatus Hydrogenedentota bacterium]